MAVIFDFDGVIADSIQGEFLALKYICEKSGLTIPFKSFEHLRENYEEPYTIMYEKCGFNWERDKPKLGLLYREFKAQSNSVSLFKGIEESIKVMHEYGISIGITTQNLKDVVVRTLEKYNILDLFGAIITEDDISSIKPNPAGILACCDRLEEEPAKTIYVGDCPTDVLAAIAAGTISLTHLRGFTTRDKFRKLSKKQRKYTTFYTKSHQIPKKVAALYKKAGYAFPKFP